MSATRRLRVAVKLSATGWPSRLAYRALDVFEGCQDMAALRFIEGRLSEKPGEKLVQFAKLLSRQALQLVHGDECDHVILRFVSDPTNSGLLGDRKAQDAAVIGHLRSQRSGAGFHALVAYAALSAIHDFRKSRRMGARGTGDQCV